MESKVGAQKQSRHTDLKIDAQECRMRMRQCSAPECDFPNSFQKLYNCRNKCVVFGDDYFEGHQMYSPCAFHFLVFIILFSELIKTYLN